MFQKFQKLALVALFWLGSIGAVSASTVTYQFEFSSNQGPLVFGPTVGQFSYDSSVALAGGGYVMSTNLLTDLSLSFGGFSFDETTANTGWLQFGVGGNLVEASFGNSCFAGGCGINSGQQQWWIRVGLPGSSPNDFAYSGYEGANTFYSSDDNRLLGQLAVPEPESIALFGIALAAFAATRRRQAK